MPSFLRVSGSRTPAPSVARDVTLPARDITACTVEILSRCVECGLLCEKCADAHVKMTKTFRAHTVIPHTQAGILVACLRHPHCFRLCPVMARSNPNYSQFLNFSSGYALGMQRIVCNDLTIFRKAAVPKGSKQRLSVIASPKNCFPLHVPTGAGVPSPSRHRQDKRRAIYGQCPIGCMSR
jgi:hypothetical protein